MLRRRANARYPLRGSVGLAIPVRHLPARWLGSLDDGAGVRADLAAVSEPGRLPAGARHRRALHPSRPVLEHDVLAPVLYHRHDRAADIRYAGLQLHTYQPDGHTVLLA